MYSLSVRFLFFLLVLRHYFIQEHNLNSLNIEIQLITFFLIVYLVIALFTIISLVLFITQKKVKLASIISLIFGFFTSSIFGLLPGIFGLLSIKEDHNSESNIFNIEQTLIELNRLYTLNLIAKDEYDQRRTDLINNK